MEIYCDDHSSLSSNNHSLNMNYGYTSYRCEKVCDSRQKCLHRGCGEQRPTVAGLHGQYRGIFKPFHLDLETNQLWFYMIHIHDCMFAWTFAGFRLTFSGAILPNTDQIHSCLFVVSFYLLSRKNSIILNYTLSLSNKL